MYDIQTFHKNNRTFFKEKTKKGEERLLNKSKQITNTRRKKQVERRTRFHDREDIMEGFVL